MRPTSRPDGPSCRLDRTLRAVRRCSPLLAVRPARAARASHRPNGPSCRLDGTLRAARSFSPRGRRGSGSESRWGPPDSSDRGSSPFPRRVSLKVPKGADRGRGYLPAVLLRVPKGVGRTPDQPGPIDRPRRRSPAESAARIPRPRARTVRPVVWTGPFALPEVIYRPAPEPRRSVIAPPTPVPGTRTARIAESAESRGGSSVTDARRPSVVVAHADVARYSAKCRSGSTTTKPPTRRSPGGARA